MRSHVKFRLHRGQLRIGALELGVVVLYTPQPAYEIYFRCNDCKREHPIHLKIHLDHGPDSKQSIADFFRGHPMPPQVMALQGHKARCLKTGRTFQLEHNDQIFLVVPNVSSIPEKK